VLVQVKTEKFLIVIQNKKKYDVRAVAFKLQPFIAEKTRPRDILPQSLIALFLDICKRIKNFDLIAVPVPSCPSRTAMKSLMRLTMVKNDRLRSGLCIAAVVILVGYCRERRPRRSVRGGASPSPTVFLVILCKIA